MSNGEGCTCNAWNESECACDADWTPQELIDARAEIKRLREELAQAKIYTPGRRAEPTPKPEAAGECNLAAWGILVETDEEFEQRAGERVTG